MKSVSEIFQVLDKCYPEAKTGLEFSNSFELLIAVMLSAQCTDKRVNIVTKELFEKIKTPEEFLLIGEEGLSEIIKSCGLYQTKSKNIIQTCIKLIEDYDGKVPGSMEKLIKLPGVGRKTASVVLIEAFDIPAVPVDTHVFRVANRIGLTNANSPGVTEKQLREALPVDIWIKMHHLLISHGRNICYAKKPKCNNCKIFEYCDFTNRIIK